jgi:hypothetical protein
MNSGSVSTAGLAGGTAGAAVIILVWVLSLLHVTVPDTVAVAFGIELSAIFHWAGLKLFGTALLAGSTPIAQALPQTQPGAAQAAEPPAPPSNTGAPQ